MKPSKIHNNFILILAVYILTLTTGYALFEGTLNVTGKVSTAPYYSSPNIPLEILPSPTDANLHHRREIIPCSTCYTSGLSFYNEELGASAFYIRYKKNWNMLPGLRIDDFYVTIKNTSAVPFTNGRIEAAARQGDYNSLSAEISTTTLNPGEECVVKMHIDNNYMATTTEQEAGFYLYYDVQKSTKRYDFIIGCKKWNA